MKLLHKYIDKDGSGNVTCVPEEAEDMWHAYNLMSEGDSLKASTIRSVLLLARKPHGKFLRLRKLQASFSEGLTNGLHPKQLAVRASQIVAPSTRCNMPLFLRNRLHTMFSVQIRPARSWKLEEAHLACDPTQHADVAAVVMQEGLAHVCLVTSAMTLVRAKIDISIPRKRKGSCSQHDKARAALPRFYHAVMQAILRHVNFDVIKCVLIASPGFVKDQFYEYVFQAAVKLDLKVLLENKGKFVLAHASSGFKHSLREILQDPGVQSKLSDTKAAGEVKALDQFYQVLQNEPSRAFYGTKHVERANEGQAIETLLISDKLFRCQDVAQRKRYVALVDSVRDNGGDVKIFSSLHISGEQLDLLTGIAALLRYPMPELEDEELSSDEEG
ncbi:meiotic cell division protein Pelota/DOM34, putative [Ixodes scapularis]|uniref:Protein pelota homolog n=1 Tax=Ixodes scapularis TaxID=6945 RepID=B7QAP9_IXOSC|nr:meiotic cell division protein Pelota/DOM34, putative [Ixodes scapularis]|eukprot:XP_002412625.1 meiotic cell division protein Pelota/DOM34, putative [Ixodes scapularis]